MVAMSLNCIGERGLSKETDILRRAVHKLLATLWISYDYSLEYSCHFVAQNRLPLLTLNILGYCIMPRREVCIPDRTSPPCYGPCQASLTSLSVQVVARPQRAVFEVCFRHLLPFDRIVLQSYHWQYRSESEVASWPTLEWFDRLTTSGPFVIPVKTGIQGGAGSGLPSARERRWSLPHRQKALDGSPFIHKRQAPQLLTQAFWREYNAGTSHPKEGVF